MLNKVVPTCANDAVCVRVFALTAKTSLSGKLNLTALFQLRPSSSSHCWVLLLNLTIWPTAGAGLPSKLVAGPRCPPGLVEPSAMVQGVCASNPGQITPSTREVVWLPVLNPATYTVVLSGPTASARGVSVKNVIILIGLPPTAVPRLAGLKTQTSARPTLGVVNCGSPAPGTSAMEGSVRCCPRCAVVMNARAGEPANTTSRGSSPTSRVRTTRGVPTRLTTLTLSDRWLTTQTSESSRAATATGSNPTGTRACNVSPPDVTPKISRVLSGVFTAKSLAPLGDSATGRTCPLSNSVNGTPAEEAWLAAVEGGRSSARNSVAVIAIHNANTHPFTRSRFM